MGVHGLYTQVTEQQSLWRILREQELPLLVVDAGSFRYEMCRHFFFGTRHGGDYFSLKLALETFLRRFLGWGWEMVFVFDGVPTKWKDQTWQKRTEADIARADRDSRGVGDWDDCLPPILSGAVLSAALARLGIEALQADGDADGVVASVARERQGMVVSRDSDLMLMRSRGYIDMPQFFQFGLENEDALLVLEPLRLWQHLGITQAEVPLFATLCGNDFVPFDQMRPWLQTLRKDSASTGKHATNFSGVVDFLHGCQQKSEDLLTAAKRIVPESLHLHFAYSVTDFYDHCYEEWAQEPGALSSGPHVPHPSGSQCIVLNPAKQFESQTPTQKKNQSSSRIPSSDEEDESKLLLDGMPLSDAPLAMWRRRELSGAMLAAANRGYLALPAMVEEGKAPSSWLLSRPLRAAAVKLLPGPVVERLRKSCGLKVEEAALETCALEPPFKWPYGLEGASLEARRQFFREAVDWPRLEEDCGEAPPRTVLPLACLRFLVLSNADQTPPPLDIPWPYLGVLLLQLALSPKKQQEMVADLRVQSTKAYCPAAVSFLNTYLGALWSVSLLNEALGRPYEALDVIAAYNGPFLHAMIRSLHAGSSDHRFFSTDDQERVVLRLSDVPQEDLIGRLLPIFSLGVVEEVGKKAFSGKVSGKKLKFTMPCSAAKPKPERKSSKPSKPSNAFEALRS